MEIEAVIEIPKGSRNKYEIDHDSGAIWLDRMLFTATQYPADYGFVFGTHADDGDPLDVLVLLDDLPGHLTEEISHFFAVYKELEPGKGTDVIGWRGAAEAEEIVRRAQAQAH